jgi:hypothetical protein
LQFVDTGITLALSQFGKELTVDPNYTFPEMQDAACSQDWDTATERDETLRDWIDRGGFTPIKYTEIAFRGAVNSVLRRRGKRTISQVEKAGE